MAFGSGAALGTDLWTGGPGSPFSVPLPRVGKAPPPHQRSSQKPTAHSESAAANSINPSRRLFSLVQKIGGGDPAVGPLPAPPEQARERRPDGRPGDPPLGDPLLEGDLGGHRERPQARLPAELPRR